MAKNDVGSLRGFRANAMWGKGGRGLVVVAVASLVMVLPATAAAANGRGPMHGGRATPVVDSLPGPPSVGVAYEGASYSDASYDDASYSDASYSDASYEDASYADGFAGD
jgi:hypothetical protein